jgi:hypothetical protein
VLEADATREINNLTSHELILISGLAAMASGWPAALLGKKANAVQTLSTLILVVANGVGAYAVYRWWIDGPIDPLLFPAPLANVSVSIAIDAISGCFERSDSSHWLRPCRLTTLGNDLAMFEHLSIYTIVHIVVALIFPSFLLGVINRVKTIVGGRRGQPLLQAYFDLRKLFSKDSVFSEMTTWVFRFGPVVPLTAALIAVIIVPLGEANAPLAFSLETRRVWRGTGNDRGSVGGRVEHLCLSVRAAYFPRRAHCPRRRLRPADSAPLWLAVDGDRSGVHGPSEGHQTMFGVFQCRAHGDARI